MAGQTAGARELIRPMMASAGELPPASDSDRWSFEMKWDGVRAVTYLDDRGLAAMTRNDRDVVGSYPELTVLREALGGRRAVLDGEVVALDAAGRPDFGRLQQRMHVADPAAVARLTKDVPVAYLVFDVLELDGHRTLDLSYDERRELLEALELVGPGLACPPAFLGAGDQALATSLARGLEGVVAKRRDSTYLPGRRTTTWLKVKNLRMQEVVVGGWRPGRGRRDGGIGSLLLGVQDGEGLVYVGHVGTGFGDAALAHLLTTLSPLRRPTSPFAHDIPRADSRDAVWVDPTVVGEVVFGEWTRDGRLRHPVWRGLRPDKEPADVVRES